MNVQRSDEEFFANFTDSGPTRLTIMRTPVAFMFQSTPVEFLSDFSLEESVARLKAVVMPSVFHTLFAEAVVGKIRSGSVSLGRYIPMVGNSFKPFFRGTFQERSGRIVLAGVFTMHPWMKVLMTFWFGFFGVVTLSISAAAIKGTLQINVGFAFIITFGFFALGFGIVRWGQWLSRMDVPWLSTVIRAALLRKDE
jgi:hypothetical protein